MELPPEVSGLCGQEAGQALVGAKDKDFGFIGGRGEKGRCCLMGIEFQIYKMEKFWRSVLQQCEYTLHYTKKWLRW